VEQQVSALVGCTAQVHRYCVLVLVCAQLRKVLNVLAHALHVDAKAVANIIVEKVVHVCSSHVS
jgi:hypothetical protein